MLKQKTERVVFQPVAYQGLQRGINQIANAVRPTLGPRPRVVAVQRPLDERMPELLDNGGTIAKRIIQLPDRDEDMGAMFLRDVLWRLQDQVGDGTATAAVLFQAVYNEGVRYLACKTSADLYGLDSGDFIDGVEIMVAEEFLEQATESDLHMVF